MHHRFLEKHGCSIVCAVFLSIIPGVHAQAAPAEAPVKVAVAAPLPNTLVAGRITLSVAFDSGLTKVNAFTVLVDDMIHSSKNFIGLSPRGIQYLEFDTKAWPDGNHNIKIVAMGPRGALGTDSVDVTIRNGLPGGPDLVPPLVQIRNFQDGDTVSGKIKIDILAEDNVGRDLLLSLFVNRTVRLLKSSPPYFLELDTAPFLDPATGTGTISLEAWAFDKSENLGKSRMLTLNVRPGNGQNTPVQGDPTKPITTGPMVPPNVNVAGPKTIRPDMPGGIIIDLYPNRKVEMPSPIQSTTGGNAAGNSADRVPGARPGTSAIVAPSKAVAGDFAPLGGDASGKPAGSKTVVPGNRPDSRISKAAGQVTAPKTLQGKVDGGGLSGARVSRPSNQRPVTAKAGAGGAVSKPQPLTAASASGTPAGSGRLSTPGGRPSKPTVMAKADIVLKPSTPAVAPAARPGVSVDLPAPMVAAPMRPEMMPEMPGGPVPVPQINPTLSPIFRSAQPGARMAKAPSKGDLPGDVKLDASDPMIVVVDSSIKPNANGRIPVQVYKLAKAPLPKEQSYRVSRNDSLESLARKFRVTPKSIMVANGITGAGGLKSGSIVKIPGSFDVVVNHKRVAFDVAPRVENGLPLAPFRQIFEHSGGVVVWYGESQEVRAATETKDVKIKIGSKEAKVNQMVVVMEKAAFIDSGRTIVPMSFLEKALDMVAEYDVRTRSIHLVKK